MDDDQKKLTVDWQGDKGHQPPPCPHGRHYTVQKGDSMFLIAQRFGISLAQLIAANPQVKDPDLIFPGQILCIPVKTGGHEPDGGHCPMSFYYTVQPGDTLHSIAAMFCISVEQLLAANPSIQDPHCISPGQCICIPVMLPPKHHCHCFCLHPTHHCPAAMGMGWYDRESQELMVVARGLHNPEHYGMDSMVMMAGCGSWDEFEAVEMTPIGTETMMCRHHMRFSSSNPVVLIGPARRFPRSFGPILLVAVIPL